MAHIDYPRTDPHLLNIFFRKWDYNQVNPFKLFVNFLSFSIFSAVYVSGGAQLSEIGKLFAAVRNRLKNFEMDSQLSLKISTRSLLSLCKLYCNAIVSKSDEKLEIYAN